MEFIVPFKCKARVESIHGRKKLLVKNAFAVHHLYDIYRSLRKHSLPKRHFRFTDPFIYLVEVVLTIGILQSWYLVIVQNHSINRFIFMLIRLLITGKQTYRHCDERKVFPLFPNKYTLNLNHELIHGKNNPSVLYQQFHLYVHPQNSNYSMFFSSII